MKHGLILVVGVALLGLTSITALVCYVARVDLPLLDEFDDVPDVYSASEFGTEQVDLSKKLELCVPSRRVP